MFCGPFFLEIIFTFRNVKSQLKRCSFAFDLHKQTQIIIKTLFCYLYLTN